ncbi:methyl-accepting chemotaxis protein [uncultured Selenomonas sp.]|uniref:methyl-accepting chemotaxis protein n=1 Tax=uncultured Selenomonas sp. TaxID=159275 RepID=UPI0028D6BDA8|nr:methyl-accepting chemotaxis protein [uncultured Selenomonas sp.]
MHGLTVSKKIILSFAILIALFVGFAGYASYAGRALNETTAELMVWTDSLAVTSRIATATVESRRITTVWALAEDGQARDAAYDRVRESRKKVDELFAAYDRSLNEASYESEEERRTDREIYEKEHQAWQAYLDGSKECEALFMAGKKSEAMALMGTKVNPAYQKFSELIEADEARTFNSIQQLKLDSDAAYDGIVRMTFLSAVFVILAAGICGFLLLRTISSAVDGVLTSLRRVAGGDLSIHLPADAGDEFSLMAEQCNKMLDNIRAMTKTIQQTSSTVSGASDTLTSSAGQAAEATQSVAQSITEVAEAAEAQLTSVAETEHQVRAFNRGLTAATETIESVAADIEHTSQKAEEGNRLVMATVDQMNAIADTVIASSDVVAKLGERSKEIGNIVEVISGISGQTNLLALNAAIEAARAGEHGHGFAVVAEEVRKLAEESQQASKQISALISAIQAETEQAVTAMETGREEAEKGRENVAASGKGFSEIRVMIDRIQSSSASIKGTMEELSRRSGKISDAATAIHTAASKVAAESQTVSAATQEQAAGMEEIAASSRGLSDMAHELDAAAAKFKT